MTTAGRRLLRFQSLDEVNADVQRLLDGHTTVGLWTLSQICQHLAAAMRLALNMPATTRHDPSLRFDEESVRRVFEDRTLPEGLSLPSSVPPPEPLGNAQAAAVLRDAIADYARSPGPVASHRLLGPLTKTQWDQLQLIHCAHHLSFAVPTP